MHLFIQNVLHCKKQYLYVIYECLELFSVLENSYLCFSNGKYLIVINIWSHDDCFFIALLCVGLTLIICTIQIVLSVDINV